jgi:hypothetical protein
MQTRDRPCLGDPFLRRGSVVTRAFVSILPGATGSLGPRYAAGHLGKGLDGRPPDARTTVLAGVGLGFPAPALPRIPNLHARSGQLPARAPNHRCAHPAGIKVLSGNETWEKPQREQSAARPPSMISHRIANLRAGPDRAGNAERQRIAPARNCPPGSDSSFEGLTIGCPAVPRRFAPLQTPWISNPSKWPIHRPGQRAWRLDRFGRSETRTGAHGSTFRVQQPKGPQLGSRPVEEPVETLRSAHSPRHSSR